MKILYFTRDYTPHDYRFLSALAQTSHQVFYLRLEKRGHALEDRPLPEKIEQVAWEGRRKTSQAVRWLEIHPRFA
jgi:L-malate glycosyltransferase